jgi:hypothetical protein
MSAVPTPYRREDDWVPPGTPFTCLVRLRPSLSLAPGSGIQGPLIVLEHAGQLLPLAPGSPGGTGSQAGSPGRAKIGPQVFRPNILYSAVPRL